MASLLLFITKRHQFATIVVYYLRSFVPFEILIEDINGIINEIINNLLKLRNKHII